MDKKHLYNIAKNIVSVPKGILAADESLNTIKKRFELIGIHNSLENRRKYRHLLITAEKAIQNYISGIILFDETIRQKDANDSSFADIITKNKSIVGIKVDQGLEEVPNKSNEKYTKGLQGLSERFYEYYQLGAKFAKWRAVFSVNHNGPCEYVVTKNIQDLVEYAKIAQQQNIVPIIEPEVLMENDCDITKCQKVTANILKKLFEEIDRKNVYLQGIILKPNMILPGKYCQKQSETHEIAEKTCLVLQESLPEDLLGIAFLSGGQTDIQATENLNTINEYLPNAKWKITFSFGRALQSQVLKIWSGKDANIKKAQQKLAHRASMNSLATKAKWKREYENDL